FFEPLVASRVLHSFPTRRSSDLGCGGWLVVQHSPNQAGGRCVNVAARSSSLPFFNHDTACNSLAVAGPVAGGNSTGCRTGTHLRSEERRVGKECRSECATEPQQT